MREVALASASAEEEAQLTDACHRGEAAACETLSREEEAKRAWLARVDERLNEPWGKAAAEAEADDAMADAMATAELADACDQGDCAACDTLSREEEAKRAWLARLQEPWGPGVRG
jgi:uncharacterized damage-inducible protein DinB